MAEYLGVTAQAISRWESGTCYPDIELLPAIVDFFGISLDELIGIDQSKKETKINEFIEKANRTQSYGNFAEAVSVYRNAVSLYPSSYKLQAFLASAISCIDNGEKISNELAIESINICNRILEDCVDDSIRYHALNILCWVYFRQLDDLDKAMNIVAKLPDIFGCQEFIQAETLKIRMPSKKAEEFIYSLASAMLITFDRQNFAYCNNKKVMLQILIGELNNLLAALPA